MGITIYFHGRPQGQNVWSTKDTSTAQNYLAQFLDSKIGGEVPDAMVIDIVQNCSYYTYLHRKNVAEKSLRPNAYMAITIRFDNKYCKNVSTLYSLLSQVYGKLISGQIIRQDGDKEQFLISLFEEKADHLSNVSAIIEQNVEQAIASSLIDLGKVKDSSGYQIIKFNLKDADSPTFCDVTLASRVVISPYYRSKDDIHNDDLQRITPLESEIASLTTKSNNLKEKLDSATYQKELLERSNAELQQTIKSKDAELKVIEVRVADKFKKELEDSKKRVKDVEGEYQKIKRIAEGLDSEKKRLEKKVIELEKKGPKSTATGNWALGYPQTTNPEHENLIRLMAGRFPVLSGNSTKNSRFSFKKITLWLLGVNVVLLLVIVALDCHIVFHIEKVLDKNLEAVRINIEEVDDHINNVIVPGHNAVEEESIQSDCAAVATVADPAPQKSSDKTVKKQLGDKGDATKSEKGNAKSFKQDNPVKAK